MLSSRILNGLFAAGMALGACSPAPDSSPKPPAVQASAPVSAPAVAATEGPPTANGAYIIDDCQGTGGCPYRNWRAVEARKLYADSNTSAAVIGTLVPGEWLAVQRVESRILPQRGLVIADVQAFKAGDVIFLLADEGEGFTSVWRRGEFLTLNYGADPDPNSMIRFDDQPVPEALQARLGRWALVRRDNGQQGWLHDGSFECMGKLAGDEGCRD